MTSILKITLQSKAAVRAPVILYIFYASIPFNEIGILFLRMNERIANVEEYGNSYHTLLLFCRVGRIIKQDDVCKMARAIYET